MLAPVIAAVVVVYSWNLQVLAGTLQVLGIALAAFGLAVVRSSLELVGEKAIAAKHGLDRLWALRRERLRNWWGRVRKRPVVVHVPPGVATFSGVSPQVVINWSPVDRNAISDRDWLAFLDNQVEALFNRMGKAEQAHSADQGHLRSELAAQRDELRAEIQRETRQGWQLIVAGLIWSAAGAVVGIFG